MAEEIIYIENKQLKQVKIFPIGQKCYNMHIGTPETYRSSIFVQAQSLRINLHYDI